MILKRIKNEIISFSDDDHGKISLENIKKFTAEYRGGDLELRSPQEGYWSEVIICKISSMNQNLSLGEPEGWKF